MILLHFINGTTDQEYVVFSDQPHEGYDHAATEEENARPGFTLRGAWSMDISPLNDGPHIYGYFLPGEGDVYMMDR